VACGAERGEEVLAAARAVRKMKRGGQCWDTYVVLHRSSRTSHAKGGSPAANEQPGGTHTI